MNNIYQNVPNDYSNKNSHYHPLVSNCYSEQIRIADSEKVAVHMGDGWCTFPDLDNFDSDKLLRALTLKEPDSCDSIWDPNNPNNESNTRKATLSISALRQLEALFNLSQLLFGLSRAETVNYTFRDLQLRKYPHSFKKSGFKQLNVDGRIDFYAIFEQLVQNIIEEGGLEVTLLIYKNPVLPMVRQKCLDLISNVATVPTVACKIMRQHSWFLDHLLIMVRDGDIISDKIPALSVLIRLLKVMLTERMMSSYMKLVDMQYIDCLVDIFENPRFTEASEYLPFFIKFEFITMQSLTVILGDSEYSQFWSDKAKTHLLNYCMIVLLKAAGAYPTTTISPINQECIENINHIFYAEQHSHKHSLAHTIMTVTELLRNDENMKLFYRYHRPFKQLIVQLYKKYGAKSQYIRTDPGISYALNHLMRVLYIKNSSDSKQSSNYDYYDHKQLISTQSTSSHQPPRICSNPDCKNEETKYKSFKECSHCNGKAGYCSSKCRKEHISYHRKFECSSRVSSSSAAVTASSSSTNNYENYPKQNNNNKIYDYLPNSFTNRRNSENHFHNNQDMDIYGTISSGYSRTSKRLSKYASLNENHRRISLNLAKGNNNYVNVIQPLLKQSNEKIGSTSSTSSSSASTSKPTYSKHTSSMKEIKSTNHNQYRRASHLDDEANFKAKLINTRNINDIKQQQHQQMDETNSIHFLRPLKTSTALCLADLTRKQKGVVSDTSSTASGESSSTKLQPIIKKFKSSNSKSTKEKPRRLDTSPPTPKKESTNLNLSNHKRRHSATATILTTTKTTTTTTTTKTKTKLCESADVKSSSSSSSSTSAKNAKDKDAKSSSENKENKNNFNEFFYHGKQETSNNVNINKNEFNSANFYLFKKKQEEESYSDNDDTEDEVEVDDLSVTSSSNTNTSSTNSNKNTEKQSEEDEEEDDEEVEGERLAIRSNLYVKNNYRSNNDDEQDRLSKFKVVKEFEKTLELVQNASNYKLLSSMTNTKLSSNDDNVDGASLPFTLPQQQIQQQSQLGNLMQPQLSLASLCYDENNKDGNESDSNGESEEDESNKNSNPNNQDNDLKKTSSSKLKNFNFIINNSIESHMLTNSFQVNQTSKMNRRPSTTNSNYQYVDEEEISMFKNKNDSLNNPNKIISDYKTFKIPLLTINASDDESTSQQSQQIMPLSLQPINEDNFVKPGAPPPLKSNKYSELKVFNNLESENQPPLQQTTKIKSNPQFNALLTADLPKNSTPIFTDSNTAAILLNKRKQLLNAKLDLTIAPPSSSVQILNTQQNTNNERKPTFLVPKVPNNNKFSSNSLSALQKEQEQCQQPTSTLSPQQELPVITLDETIQLANGVMGSGALNLSKIYSIETAVSTDLVSVAKTEIPKDLKKCFKDEIKKDKSKCIIS